MSDTDDEEEEMEIVDPKAAKKQVRPATPSGWNFFPWVPTIEILNINMLLKLLRFNQSSRDDVNCSNHQNRF